MPSLGRILIAVGVALVVAGVVVLLLERFGLGRLPGDLQFERRGVRVSIPLGTMLVLSLLLTLILNLVARWRR